MKRTLALTLGLTLSGLVHAAAPASPGFRCAAFRRQNGRVLDETLTLTPAVDPAVFLSEGEALFVLTGRLASLTSLANHKGFRDDLDQVFPADQAYEVLPTKFRCFTSVEQPMLGRCDQAGPLILKNLKDLSEHPLAGDQWDLGLTIRQQTYRELNPTLEERTQVIFTLGVSARADTGQLVALSNETGFSSSACALLK